MPRRLVALPAVDGPNPSAVPAPVAMLRGPAAWCLVPLVLTLFLPPPALARDLAQDVALCRAIGADAARLACYDRLAAPKAVARFDGNGGAITPLFTLTAPGRLNFTSRDAVMVIYLLDKDGAVVRNLHRAGAGDGTFLIADPGSYSLQINATGAWRVEILPEEPH